MRWSEVISLWESGQCLKYPESISKRFFYETTFCDAQLSNQYLSKFIESNELNQIKDQDFTDFAVHISKARANARTSGAYGTSFINKSGNAILVIPLPINGRNYATLKDFIDNAPQTQQSEFWKMAAYEIKQVLKFKSKVWINTHGLGVSYFHLRIDFEPKYYLTKEFITYKSE